MPFGLFQDGNIVHRPHQRVAVKWISDANVVRFLSDEFQKIFVDAAVHQHALCRATNLPSIEICAESSGFGGAREIGILQYDLRPVAA